MSMDPEDTQDDDDTLLLDEPIEDAPDEEQDTGDADEGDEDDDGAVYFDGDDAAEKEDDPDLVKHLRSKLRETQGELARVKKPAPPPEIVDPGPRPKLVDYDYDEEAHDTAVDAWITKRDAAKDAEREAAKTGEQVNEKLTRQYNDYRTKAVALGRVDFQEAETTVVNGLSKERLAYILDAADDPAKVMYALGKSPAKLDAMAAIDSDVRFIKEISKLEGTIRMGTKRTAPAPERVAQGSRSTALGGGDKRLAELEKKADATGDRTALIAYRFEQRKGK